MKLTVPIGTVTYSNNDGAGPFVATLTASGALTDGEYRTKPLANIDHFWGTVARMGEEDR